MFVRRLFVFVLLIVCCNICLGVEFDTLRFNDGSYAVLLRHRNYSYYDLIVDSITTERKTFTAMCDGCGKGIIGLTEGNLKLIKEQTVYEDIDYYSMISDWEENLPDEPTALDIKQNDKEFYITCSKQSRGKWDSVCDLPKDTPLIFKAYLFNVHCGKEIFQEVIIYQIETL